MRNTVSLLRLANRSNETVFLITARDVVIGACGFAQVDRHPPEIGYWLGTKYWGKGYATEAVRALIDHAFTDLDSEALQAAACSASLSRSVKA